MGTNKDWDRRIAKGAGTGRKGQEQGKSDSQRRGQEHGQRDRNRNLRKGTWTGGHEMQQGLAQGQQPKDKNKGLGQEQKDKNKKRGTGTGRNRQEQEHTKRDWDRRIEQG